MSLHRSLRVDTAGAQQRTVLTRIERIKDLMKKDLWPDGRKVTALPKVKIVKLKAKKAKGKKEETDGAAKKA
jgi:small basic protein (TIGR04137 family)